jgi:hypothetical protein
MEGSSLSDEAVINLLNAKFVALFANFDVYGFPEGIPAIDNYRRKWMRSNMLRTGIATSAVVDPSGRKLLGESGSSFYMLWKTATNYHPDKFLAYLEHALANWQLAERP